MNVLEKGMRRGRDAERAVIICECATKKTEKKELKFILVF